MVDTNNIRQAYTQHLGFSKLYNSPLLPEQFIHIALSKDASIIQNNYNSKQQNCQISIIDNIQHRT